MKKIGIIGASGKTGSRILRAFLQNPPENYEVEFAIVSNESKFLGQNVFAFCGLENQRNLVFSNNLELALKDSEIIIDFSSAKISKEIIDFEKLELSGKKFIFGTTPFIRSDFKNFDQFVLKNLLFYSPNMSILVNLLGEFLGKYSKFFCENYDLGIHEIHHIHKKDSPSGTAKMLSEKLGSYLSESKEQGEKKIQISSAKISEIFGIHEIFMASPFEIFEIKHQALNRDLFSDGVLKIVNWILAEKKENGFFEMKDFLKFL